MLSHRTWARTGLATLMVVALLLGAVAWAAKPPKPPPEPPPIPVTYELTWLGGFASSYVYGMNSQGHVVGSATSPDLYGGDSFAFLYTPETGMIDLNTLLPEGSPWHLSIARDINDLGQIAGYYAAGDLEVGLTRRAFRFTRAVTDSDGNILAPAVVEEIGPVNPDDENNIATGINNLGEVCGRVRYDGPPITRISWFYSDVTGFQTLLPEMSLYASTINNASQILGLVEDGTQTTLFRVIPGDTPEYIHSPVGSDCVIWHDDMNDSGWFVGRTALEATIKGKIIRLRYGAYRYDDGGFLDLGAGDRSEAFGINNLGDVVGTVGDGSGFVVLEGLGLVNLDEVVTGNPDDLAIWFDADTTINPRRINDAGQIAGWAYFPLSRTQQAFLITPVPSGN